MEKRFVIIIWHQAGGSDDNKIYYIWSDHNENALVFGSKEEAIRNWNEAEMYRVHCGFVVECTAKTTDWIF